MKFSDTTNKDGIIQMCEFYTNKVDADISGDTTLLKRFTALCNIAMREILSIIFKSYGGWIYDDSNHSDLPQATTDLVSGQATYALDSEIAVLQRVEIKDNAGNWHKVDPVAEGQISEAIDEFHETTGQPLSYRLVGQTIELFPAPNYASTKGLKLYFKRDIHEFVSTDTDATPGFISIYHNAIPTRASLLYLKVALPKDDRIPQLKEDWENYKREIGRHYSERYADMFPNVLQSTDENYE